MENNKALRSETNKHPKSPTFTIMYREKGKAKTSNNKRTKRAKIETRKIPTALKCKLYFSLHFRPTKTNYQ